MSGRAEAAAGLSTGRRRRAVGRRVSGIRLLRAVVQLALLALFTAMAWAASYPPSGYYPDNLFLRMDPLNALATASRGFRLSLALPALLLLLLTALSGRFFCAWVCPLGTCFDCLPSLGRKKRPLARMRPRALIGETGEGGGGRLRLKYLGLLLVLALQVAGVGLLWLYDPLVIANRAVVFVLGGTVPLVFLALLLLAMLYRPRFWCQELCPAGAFFSAVSALGKKLPEWASPLALRKDEGCCIHCGRCASACPFEITGVADAQRSGRLALADCALCGECVAACPREGALALTSFGARVLRSGKRAGRAGVSEGGRED